MLGQDFSYESPGHVYTYQDPQTNCSTLLLETSMFSKMKGKNKNSGFNIMGVVGLITP